MFPYNIETKVHIAASPEEVIARLVDCDGFPSWSTFIRKMAVISDHKEVVQGCRLAVEIDLKGDGQSREFKPMVIAKSGQELRWVGTLGAAALLRGEHYFTASPGAAGDGCDLVHGETMTGLLCPLMAAMGMMADTTAGFERLNEELKRTFL
jgi:hypothetical protein